ncbi:unnamed protein product [Rotaria socialis]|uniref:Mos1 transposase HTH domain-containing protein n=2 Tax=Rotaria socialis TaxID=392032 RepID=A0A817PFH7_9BILA|nr:unnamed protein product [Rotaria socialis]
MDADHELKMDLSRREIRVFLLLEFRLGRKATEAANNICSTMGEDILSIRTAQHWFNRFKNGNFELDDLPRPGKPLEVDADLLKQLIEQDPRLTSRCLAEQLGCSHTAVEKHPNELGKKWRYGVWILRELSPHQLQHRVDACMDLMTSHRNYQWLRNLIIGDEKWVLYINYTHRRQWLSSGQTGVATSKADLHPKKVMLSVWSGVNGIIHWKFFQMVVPSLLNSTVNNWSSFQLQKSRIVDYSHLNQHDPDFDSDSDDSSGEEDEDTTGNCTDNEDSTEDDDDYVSDHFFKVSSTTFQGMRVFDSINPTLAKSYFIVNINGTKNIYFKQTAAWQLSNDKSTLSSDRLKGVLNK